LAPLFKLKHNRIMKKNSLLAILLISVFAVGMLSGCKDNKKRSLKEMREDFLRPAEMTLQKADTDEVTSLVKLFLQHVEQKNIDQAMAMLYFLDKDSITSLPPKVEKKERFALNLCSGKPSTIDYMLFLKETDSEVKYSTILFDKKPGDNRPNKMSFIIKPVRRDGKWYLTLADTEHQEKESEVEKFN